MRFLDQFTRTDGSGFGFRGQHFEARYGLRRQVEYGVQHVAGVRPIVICQNTNKQKMTQIQARIQQTQQQ